MTTRAAVATAVRTLEIDRSHSEVAFQVRHLLSKVRGRFTDFAGTIEFDESNPQNSRLDVTIQAASIDTAEADRDKHLRSADFFEVEKYPDAHIREHLGDPPQRQHLRRPRQSHHPRGDQAGYAARELPWRRSGSVGKHEVRLRGRADVESQGFRPYLERCVGDRWLSCRGRGQGVVVHSSQITPP